MTTVVAGMVDQCGSKSDARWPGEREILTTTQTFRQFQQVPAKFQQSSDRKVQTFYACLPWAAGVLGVLADMVGQCGSKHDERWPEERKQNDHDSKVPTVTTKFRQVPASSASSGRFRQVTQVPTSYASSSMFLQVPASSGSSDN